MSNLRGEIVRETGTKFWQTWRSPHRFQDWRQRWQQGLSLQGFTLIELLVSSVLISMVILIAWSGLISLMNMSAVSEARGMRAIELNQALDFLSAEVRTARRVNATANGQLSPTTSLEELLQNAGFDLTRLGNRGELVLYLELPTTSPVPPICPVGGPNAGAAPPFPSDFDQVIYDVRPSPSAWLSPKVTMRYGRVKDDNGIFNPCENPISSDPVADALSDDVSNVPSCPGVLTGGPGFYVCQEQNQANLLLQNQLVDDSVRQTSMVATPRLETIQIKSVADIGCQNEAMLRTRPSKIPVPYSFYNRRSTDIHQYVLDAMGQPQSRGVIRAGDQVDGTTDLESVWVFEDTHGACVQVAMPEQANATFTVVLPPENLAGASLPQALDPLILNSDPPLNPPDLDPPAVVLDPLPDPTETSFEVVTENESTVSSGGGEDSFEQQFTFEQRSEYRSSPGEP
ncbi:MAG: prepilin-type N-terminal cleavage/methylation domain-containing protein [Acaryochloridaceae cyanobacterium RL_2_7]|nr:prepilin-type N-terminal cleavage/methylation domain-containing protein [Acaryochloridaceae cyanobacterium RL_2_7]